MKRILISVVLCMICIAQSFAQKLEYNTVSNNVCLMRVGAFEMKLGDDFEFCLDMLTDLNRKQYFIVARSEQNKVHNFPPESKLLLKLSDDTTLELSSCYRHFFQPKELSIIPMAWFPITEDQLQNVISTGVTKVRIELLSLNEKEQAIFSDYQDAEYKKDKLGASFKKMLEVLDKEYAKLIEKQEKLKRKNASEDF